MKKRLFIILLVIAALLLAGLGTIIGTGGRLMLSLAVAAPLAFLPIVSLVATLRWMAVSGARGCCSS